MEEKNGLYNTEEENKTKNSRNKLILVLGAAILVAAIVLTVALVSVVLKADDKKKEGTTMYVLSTTEFAPTTTEEVNLDELLNGDKSTEEPATVEGESKSTTSSGVKDTTKNAFVESYEHLSDNGDNYLSDHFENEFIQMVHNQYGVDPDLLVAIYSVPNSGTNFVLEFNGDKRGGNYVKSPDTLEKVYHIDIDGNITVATGTNKGNVGVSYPESVMTVAMVKTVVMEQYPDYFTGLKND